MEVALSLQFEPLASLTAAHLGLLWGRFRSQFPKTQDQPRLRPAIEKFGVRVVSPGQSFGSDIGVGAPAIRCWFLNDLETELIQVQRDRFIHNWRRKSSDNGTYPRYETLRRSFAEELGTFADFLRREKLGEIRPNQCELIYVNHVVAGTEWENHSQLGNIATVWKALYSQDFLPEQESAAFEVRYQINSQKDTPAGRLYINFAPAFREADSRPIYIAQLLARGAPAGGTLEGAFKFLDLAHEWVVQAFASIMSEQMHREWGRR